MSRTHKLPIFILSFILSICSGAHADTPTFDNLTDEDFDKISKEFSANSTLHSVMGAGSLGSIFGFQVGLTGGITKTPETDAIVKRSAPSSSVQAFPHAALLAAVTIPFGLTAEATFIPQINSSGFEYNQYAGALKWTMTDNILSILPLNIAVRGFLSKTTMSFSQVINNSSTGNQNVDATVKYDGTVTGLQLLASPKLIPIIEPYVGVGVLSGNSKLSSSIGSVFASGSTSKEVSPTSTQFLLGADIRLLLIGAGVEYSRAFGTESYTMKFSLGF